MKLLIEEPIKNIKIIFNEKESNIIYDEYYFNGISIPKDIKFSDIGINNFKISWKIDDIKIININKKEIKLLIQKDLKTLKIIT